MSVHPKHLVCRVGRIGYHVKMESVSRLIVRNLLIVVGVSCGGRIGISVGSENISRHSVGVSSAALEVESAVLCIILTLIRGLVGRGKRLLLRGRLRLRIVSHCKLSQRHVIEIDRAIGSVVRIYSRSRNALISVIRSIGVIARSE